MNKRIKRFEKIIFGFKKEYKIEEIQNFLNHYRYVGRQTASSHITFRRKDYEPIIIVVHHNLVNQLYIKKMVRILRRQQII